MYSVGRHSRRSSSCRNRTGKPYAAHLARLDYLLIYLPTQVQLTFTKIIKIASHQMTDFKAKMHQIWFRLCLRPRPRWGSLQRSPRTPSWIWGALLLRGGEWRWGEGGDGKGGEGKGKGHEPPSIWRKFTPMEPPLMLSERGNILTSTEKPTTSKADPPDWGPHRTQARRPPSPVWHSLTIWNHLHSEDSCGFQWHDVNAVTPEFPLDLQNTSPEYFRHLESSLGTLMYLGTQHC